MAVRSVSAAEADRLANKHIRLVWKEAHRFARRYRSTKESHIELVDELFSEGIVILAMCINAYRPQIGKLSTILTLSLRRQFYRITGLRKKDYGQKGKPRVPSVSAILDCDHLSSIDAPLEEQSQFTLFEEITARPFYSFGRSMNQWMDILLKTPGMTPRYAAILVLHYRYGYEPVDISKMIGVTPQRVGQLCRQSLELIQKSTKVANRIEEYLSTSW
jgi:RNA polymerase sigma factor (sigma-70 family)